MPPLLRFFDDRTGVEQIVQNLAEEVMQHVDMRKRSSEAVAADEPLRWMGVAEAAMILGLPAVTLRRAIERNARRSGSGAIVATTDGVHAKKFGKLWRVRLEREWTEPAA